MQNITALNANLAQLIKQEIANKTFPAIEILYAKDGQVLIQKTFGMMDEKPLLSNTMFDLASLTKPVTIATLLMCLVDKQLIDLDDKVEKYIPEFNGQYKQNITIRQLASHVSGLPATYKLYEKFANATDAKAYLYKLPVEHKPNSKMQYSCLGYILLSDIIERVVKQPIDQAFIQLVAKPMGMDQSFFKPLSHDITPNAIAPTGRQRGIVHDGNAKLLNQIGGNAGLFSNMAGLYKFTQMLQNGGKVGNAQFLSKTTINTFFTNQNKVGLTPRTIGWEMKTSESPNTSCGEFFYDNSIGHTGFTGTSIWLNLQKRVTIIALSNRSAISHSGNLPAMAKFRKKLHHFLSIQA